MELRKSGFTIAEFVISITIMFIVVASTVPILFQKSKTTPQVPKMSGEKVCSCADAVNRTCEFELENTGRNEFLTIQLVGGGGSGQSHYGGGAAESKIVHYPNLGGKFKVVLGEGGKTNSNSPNGGTTLLLKQEEDAKGSTSWRMIEFARGGHAIFNQNYDKSILDADDPEQAKRKVNEGQMPEFSNSTAFPCGAGGKGSAYDGDAQNGYDGEVIISW